MTQSDGSVLSEAEVVVIHTAEIISAKKIKSLVAEEVVVTTPETYWFYLIEWVSGMFRLFKLKNLKVIPRWVKIFLRFLIKDSSKSVDNPKGLKVMESKKKKGYLFSKNDVRWSYDPYKLVRNDDVKKKLLHR